MAQEHTGAKPVQKEKAEASIIRMAGRDINGRFKIVRALDQIKGVGYNMARAISSIYTKSYGVDENTELGALTDAQLADLEGLLKDLPKAGVPGYMMNRRRDAETGQDTHLVGTDLIVRTRQDIDNGIKLQTWTGSRHQYGQKVRGQRTRSTGRTGATVGVVKKAVQAQQKESMAAQRSAAAAGTSAQAESQSQK